MIALRHSIQRTVDRFVGSHVRLTTINVNAREIYAGWNGGHVTMTRTRSIVLTHTVINASLFAEDRTIVDVTPAQPVQPVQPIARHSVPRHHVRQLRAITSAMPLPHAAPRITQKMESV